jgi:peptidoglycan hydrolase-like protein with peptidoglycan-binding domain
MRTVPDTLTAAWRSGDYTGSQRAFARVTVQALWASIGGKAGGLTNLYQGVAWQAGSKAPMELPNVRRVRVQKATDNDCDQITLELYNTAPMPLGEIPERDDYGFYTFLRGEGSFSNRWEITPNPYSQTLLPDNLIRTYEGYGFDATVIPEKDPHLVQTGLWLIDEIDYTASNGIITVTARDARRVLAEEVLRPPVCRGPFYPLSFTSTHYGGQDPITGNGIAGNVLGDPHDLQLDTGVATKPPWINPDDAKPIKEPVIVHADGSITKLTYHDQVAMSYDACSGTTLAQGGNRPEFVFPTIKWGHQYDGMPTLQEGDTGDNVRILQQAVDYTGFQGVTIDGVFGPATTAAVENIQRKLGYPVTGVADHAFWVECDYVMFLHQQVRPGTKFWMSEGHSRQVLRMGEVKPYLQGKLSPSYVSRVRVSTRHPVELIYVSLYANGQWVDQGKGSVDGLPYVATFTQTNQGYQNVGPYVFNLTPPDPVTGVTKIRLTFGALAAEAQLYRPSTGWQYPGDANHWHAEVFAVMAFGDPVKAGDIGAVPPSPAENPGYYNDFTEIIKLFCAWGVFWWPSGAGHYLSDGSWVTHAPAKWDTTLGYHNNGRVYGDFEDTGTSGPATMGPDVWTNQTIADGINYIKGNIGFVFLADELGGVIWRQANIYGPGNWLGPEEFGTEGQRPDRTSDMVIIDELVTLVDLTSKASSTNAREAIVVASNDQKYAAGNSGFQLNPVNLRRVGGWFDRNFASDAECQMMADRIAIAQAMTAREYTVTIPGYPRVQLDDQVRVFERTASEGYIHYVNGIDSDNNLETGLWTYQLDTYWLGEHPDGNWGFDLTTLSDYTLAYLEARGAIDSHTAAWGHSNKKHAPQTWGSTTKTHGGGGW